jgi:hypothetical protein
VLTFAEMAIRFAAESTALKTAVGKLLTNSASEAYPAIVYHYTSLETAIKILNSFEIWCTNVSFSNDPSEGVYGESLIDNVCVRDPELLLAGARKLVAEEIEGYATSFSADPDELTQWRAYCTNGHGVSIGVDTEVLLLRTHLVFSHVQYDQSRQVGLAKAILNVFRARMLAAKSRPPRLRHLAYVLTVSFVILRAMLKDPSYHSEREYRLVDALPKDPKRHNTNLEYFQRDERSVPFFRVDLRDSNAAGNKQPVREVYVGPCLNFADAETQLRSTSAYNVQTFGIIPSRVPMRCD